MIDIEQDALRAFEQDALALRLGRVEREPDGLGIRQDEVGDFAQFRHQGVAVNRRFAETGAQSVVMRGQTVDLRAEIVEMGEVADADGATADLVLISRADAATGSADLARAAGIFAQTVQIAMERQDQRAGFGDLEILRRDDDTLSRQLRDFIAEVPRIEHDAIADDRKRAAHDARREQGQLVDIFTDDQRVPGIMTALKADDDVGTFGQPVDDLALALIAPLGTDHGHIGHLVILALGILPQQEKSRPL